MSSRIMAAVLVAIAIAIGDPAAAQVTCRANTLGAEVCVGLPAPAKRARNPFANRPRGLAGVQARTGAESGPKLTGAGRTDALGNTFLSERDLPPDRPLPGVAASRNCTRDALGNLICR